jgi:hypothetical protein
MTEAQTAEISAASAREIIDYGEITVFERRSENG